MKNQDEYLAGRCNIGEKEILLRKKLLSLSLFVTIALSCIFLFYHESKWWLLFAFLSSTASFLILLEIRNRFCVLFAIFNFYNFNQLGNLETVKCRESSRKDKNRAMQLLMYAVLCAAVYVKVIYFCSECAGL